MGTENPRVMDPDALVSEAAALRAAEKQLSSKKPKKSASTDMTEGKKKVFKPKPILVMHNYGGRRCPPEGPKEVRQWGIWDCDPSKTGAPSQRHAYGAEFDWKFDMEEKAYILEGEATLTPDSERWGDPVDIRPKDMVTFPKGWT